jgi:hypothetical protein
VTISHYLGTPPRFHHAWQVYRNLLAQVKI